MSELRRHPFRDEWVLVAPHRQSRTFHPPPGFCPLCPTSPGGFPSEIPLADYEIVVFENKFPALGAPPADVVDPGVGPLHRAPGRGRCEVVCYTSSHEGSFAELDLVEATRLARVWQDRYRELGELPEIQYVFVFENKGAELGVTLSHPHGQIYALPFVPPVAEASLRAEARSVREHGACQTVRWLEAELAEGERVVWRGDHFVAIAPFFARFPYEVWIVPLAPTPSLAAMGEVELEDLARAMLTVTRAYDRLFGFSLPYLMGMHQAPTASDFTGPAWFRVEFTPFHRAADRLKYLASTETIAGVYSLDVPPEAAADRLRRLIVPVSR